MTLDEARTIWLTLMGSGWVTVGDVVFSPYYAGTLDEAVKLLKMSDSFEYHNNINTFEQHIKIKCKS